MEQEKYLTKKGLDKLKEELNYLKKTRQKEVAEEINQAASYGDLSENAAYHHAKEALAFMRGRIAELEDIVKKAKVVDETKEKNDEVIIGSIINVECNGNKEKIAVVSLDEVDPMNNKISYQSPLGKALCGKCVGAEVEIETPRGITKYKILSIK